MRVTRREFLAGAAGAGVGFGLGAFSHRFPLPSPRVGPEWRPGIESFVPSTCLLCPARCGIRARLVDGELSRIDGNPLHPVSEGGLCPKGRAGIQLLYHPARLKGPLERVGPPGSEEFRPISWDVALERLVATLRSVRERGAHDSVAWLVGDVSGLMGELVAAFCRGFGTDHVAVDDYRDGSAEVLRLCQGIETPPAFDLAASDLVLSFGAGLAEAWWALPQAARARDNQRGASPRWVQIDARLSRTAASADEWIPIRPGAYGTLALGLAYIILKEGLYDADTLAHHAAGWEDWIDESGTTRAGLRRLVLRHGRPDAVAEATGVPVEKLVALGKSFGSAESPVAIWDQAVSWRAGGLAHGLAIHALNILCGRLNRPGGVLVQAPVSLPGPLDALPHSAKARGLAGAPLADANWPRSSGADAPLPDVAFLYQSNPVASAPNGEEIGRALAQVPLVVSFSPFLDESARHAHLILPDHTYLERWQDAFAPAAVAYPVWSVVQPVTRPLHETRATGDVILEIAAGLGGDLQGLSRWSSVEQMVRERGIALAGANRGSTFVPAFRRSELRELEGRGWWLPHGEPAERFWDRILAAGGWFDPLYDYRDRSGTSQHPDGKVWVYPAEARRRLQESELRLAEGFLPIPLEVSATEESEGESFPLQLLPYRVSTLASGNTPLMPWLLENLGVLIGSSWETWIEVNPETARALGLRAAQRVRVESREGSFEASLRLFAGAQPGVVNAPYGLHSAVKGWGAPRGANPLAAVGNRTDSVTGLPDWHATRVRLTPA